VPRGGVGQSCALRSPSGVILTYANLVGMGTTSEGVEKGLGGGGEPWGWNRIDGLDDRTDGAASAQMLYVSAYCDQSDQSGDSS